MGQSGPQARLNQLHSWQPLLTSCCLRQGCCSRHVKLCSSSDLCQDCPTSNCYCNTLLPGILYVLGGPFQSLFFTESVWFQEDIINALGITGQLLLGQPVMVKSSEVRLQPGDGMPAVWTSCSDSPAILVKLHIKLTPIVTHSQAEKNLAWEAAQQQSATLAQMNALSAGAVGAGPCKLFVGNLHPNIGVCPPNLVCYCKSDCNLTRLHAFLQIHWPA